MLNLLKKIYIIIKSHKLITLLCITPVIAVIFAIAVNNHILNVTQNSIYTKNENIPKSHTVLVPGALTNSAILNDRLYTAYLLYKQGKVKKFLLSGDHGRHDYDEVNFMKGYLLKRKVPAKDIFLDHAGFNTYSSIVRAKKVFLVKQMVIVTQKFHLNRAVYIAKQFNIKTYGLSADRRPYIHLNNYIFREFFAKIKSFLETTLQLKPKFLGKTISIYGNSKKSWD